MRFQRQLGRRRGTSMLETGFCFMVLFIFAAGMVKIGAFFWGATTVSTTADVAALSAQSAYDRVRFGPGVLSGPADAANRDQAAALAQRAAATVIDGAAVPGHGPFAFSDASCGGPAGSPLARQIDTAEPSETVSGLAIHTFTVTLRAPIGIAGECRTQTSSLSSARLGR